MNKQGPTGIEWTAVFGPGTGYTWNIGGGCFHGCRWEMSDGKIAECYAKTIAENLAQAHYPQGFEAHYFHLERLQEPLKLKKRAGIFLDSMGDALGKWVPREQFEQVIDICRQTPQHIYFLLTKAPQRIPKVLPLIPSNVWIGVSSPPDFMGSRQLTPNWKQAYLHTAFDALQQARHTHVTWMSFEPLSQDWSAIVRQHLGALRWAVLGAASNGKIYYQPDPAHVQRLLAVLDAQQVPVYFKRNLRPSLGVAFDEWRESYPPLEGMLW